jgi:hypothetical protein
VADRHERERGLPRAGGAQRVTVLTFRRRERNLRDARAEHETEGRRFAAIAEHRARTVRVDQVDVTGGELRLVERALHCERVERPRGLGRRQVEGVVRKAPGSLR